MVALLFFVAGCSEMPTSPSRVSPGATIGQAPQTTAPVPPRLSVVPPRALGVTRLVGFGDSITAGVQSSFDPRFLFAAANGGYVERLQAGLNSYHAPQQFEVFNEGLPGEMAIFALSRFRSMLTARRPEAVLLLEGINDLNNNVSVSRTIGALQDMVNAATVQGVPVLIATMYQTYESTYPDGVVRANSASIVPAFNAAIRTTFSGRLNVHLVDLEPQMHDRSLVGNDGLHPTDAGFDRMAAIFLEAVEAAFPVRGSFQ
jgi:lysophospholipase L1-like esterase